MSFLSIWLGVSAALLVQRCAVIRMDRADRSIVAVFCAVFLTIGAGFLLAGWAMA